MVTYADRIPCPLCGDPAYVQDVHLRSGVVVLRCIKCGEVHCAEDRLRDQTQTQYIRCPGGCDATTAVELDPSTQQVIIACCQCDGRWSIDLATHGVTTLQEPTRQETIVPAAWKQEKKKIADRRISSYSSGGSDWLSLVRDSIVMAADLVDHHLTRRHKLEMAKAFVKSAHGDHNVGPREKFLEVCRWFEDHAED